ncbi:hypothetical protein B566_EDAN009572, partial [Ephemera danica]
MLTFFTSIKMSFRKDFNAFVGSRTGILKGVKIQHGKIITKSTQNISMLKKDHEITSMSWGDPEENEILLGLANQTVKIYDTELQAFTRSIDSKCGEGPIVGVLRYNKSLLTAVASGEIKLWTGQDSDTLNTGEALERIRQNPYNRDIIASGGKSNDLKLWNIGANNQNVFKAKN